MALRVLNMFRGSKMVVETSMFFVRPGEAARFEQAFAQASSVLASAPGYLGHELQRCIEVDYKYILLVRWRSLEDHTVGFCKSPHYREWRALLRRFQNVFPVVEHFTTVVERQRRGTEESGL